MSRVAVSLLLSSLLGCDGYTRLSGHVVDGDGNAISSAKIDLLDGEFTVSSDESGADGSFDVAGTHAPTSKSLGFKITKEGFKNDIRQVPTESNDKLRVVLERDSEAEIE